MQQDDEHFLSRWSKRKLSQPVAAEAEQTPEQVISEDKPEQAQQEAASTSLPLWQQAEVDPALKKQALRALFKQSEFGQLDGLNEYDEDYTTFTSLGDVVTREMKRMMDLAEKASSDQQQVNAESENDVVATDADVTTDEQTDKQEGNDLA